MGIEELLFFSRLSVMEELFCDNLLCFRYHKISYRYVSLSP